MVHALKKGDIKPSDVSQSVKDVAKSMSKKIKILHPQNTKIFLVK